MKAKLTFAFVLMGFTSLVVQILLIREFLIVFYGNELTIGLILGNWIILEAVGSGLFSRLGSILQRPLSFYSSLQCLIALYFPIAIYLARAAKGMLGVSTGESIGALAAFAVSFCIIAPLSIFDGAQFPLGCRLWKDSTKEPIATAGSVYIFEALGFILAGPIFTYLFITKINSFQIVFIIGLLNLFCGLLLIRHESPSLTKKITAVTLSVILILITFLLFGRSAVRINSFALKKQWRGLHLLESQNSKFANLAVTQQAEQRTFFSDGIPIITTPMPDIVATEEFIHFGMLASPSPEDVLILGGGPGGPIAEILKYDIRGLDYAELDPGLITMVKKYATTLTEQELNDPRVSIRITDGARYIKTTRKRYDVVLIHLPFPTTLQLNRFYTQDFFTSIKKALKPKGSIVAFSLPGSLSYLSAELQKLNLSILEAARAVFNFVSVIPGESANIYIASPQNLPINASLFAKRLAERKVATRLLVPAYLEDRLHHRWQDWFYTKLYLMPTASKNTTLRPKGLYYGLLYWNSLFSPFLVKLFKFIERWLACIGVVFLAGLAPLYRARRGHAPSVETMRRAVCYPHNRIYRNDTAAHMCFYLPIALRLCLCPYCAARYVFYGWLDRWGLADDKAIKNFARSEALLLVH